MLLKYFMLSVFILGLFSCNLPPEQPTGPDSSDVKVLWSFDRDYNFTLIDIMKPKIIGDNVYIVHDHFIECRKLKTGEQVWKSDIKNFNSIDDIKLLESDGNLLFNWNQVAYSYNASNGRLNWKRDISGFVARPLIYPCQNKTHLFLPGTYGQYAMLNKATGNVDLLKDITDLVPDSVKQGAGAMQVTADGYLYVPTGYYRKNYIGAIEGNMLCYAADNGAFLWGYKVPNKKVLIPRYADSTYLAADIDECSVYGDYVAFQARNWIILLNRFSGKLIWKKDIGNEAFFSVGVLIYEDKVYASAQSGKLFCLSVASGDVLWSVDTRYSLIALLNIHGNRLYFCNDGGSGIWVVDKDTGEVIWNGQPPEYEKDDHYIYFSPVETDGKYMVNVGTRKVYCLTAPK